MNITNIFNDIYSSELNFQISTFWDSGYFINLGDEQNGFVRKAYADNFEGAVTELIRLVISEYPDSDFAKKYIKASV